MLNGDLSGSLLIEEGKGLFVCFCVRLRLATALVWGLRSEEKRSPIVELGCFVPNIISVSLNYVPFGMK